MRVQEVAHNIFVLPREHRARGIYQHAAGLHARRKTGENVALNGRQTRKLRRIFEADLRLLADDAQTGARHIGQHHVHRSDQVRIRAAGIHRAR